MIPNGIPSNDCVRRLLVQSCLLAINYDVACAARISRELDPRRKPFQPTVEAQAYPSLNDDLYIRQRTKSIENVPVGARCNWNPGVYASKADPAQRSA